MSDLTDPAYGVACPDCQQPANQPCLYLPIRGIDQAFAHYRSAKVQARAALTGTPTKRPHVGRTNAWAVMQSRRLAARRRALLWQQGLVAEASPLRREIARLEAEFDRQEYEALRAWLAQYAGILTRTHGR